MYQQRSSNRAHDRECFYKYTSVDVARLILSQRKLRWSSPRCFNDPFDVPRTLVLGFDEDDLHRAVTEEVARLIEVGTELPEAQHSLCGQLLQVTGQLDAESRQALAEDLRASLRDGSLQREATFDRLSAFWESLLPRFRILCLSELKDSTSMWAHYSTKHRGAVIELACKDELDSAWLAARPVAYMDTPPTLATLDAWVRAVTGQGSLSYDDLFEEYEYAKSTAWAYEKEWRVVTFARPGEDGLYMDRSIHPQEINAVYLGHQMSDSDAAEILQLLDGEFAHVKAFRAIPDPSALRFTFEQI